jgi:RNA polymerase sigma-70 factor (ECF subfamily)
VGQEAEVGVSQLGGGQRPADRHVVDDDRTLVVAVQAGDVAAYEELFRRHHTAVKRVCARRLGSQVEADEAAQATFVRALERIDRCLGDRRFGAWVQVIAQRLCVDMVRARARTTPDDDPLRNQRTALNVGSDLDAGTATEEALVRRERSERVHQALALLPDRQREVVVARHLEGRRPPEIAASLGLSVGAVDSLLLRGRRRLALSYEHVLAVPAVTPVLDLRA